jgi:tetratricopeptide (TPR) repeat protein
LILVALLAAATPVTALAGDTPASADMERGKVLYENGATLYEEGNYEAAIAAFEESLKLTGEKSLYYNIANCYERLGRWQSAYDALNMYRAFAPAEERDTLERRIRSVDDRLREERMRATQAPPPEPAVSTPAPAPAATPPAPSSSTASNRTRGTANWAMLGTGAGLVVLGSVGTGVSWSASRANIESNDATAYATNRGLNNASIAVAGVGAVIAVVGVAVPLTRTGMQLGLSNRNGTTAVTLNGHW